jgi:hypothetical protein
MGARSARFGMVDGRAQGGPIDGKCAAGAARNWE